MSFEFAIVKLIALTIVGFIGLFSIYLICNIDEKKSSKRGLQSFGDVIRQ